MQCQLCDKTATVHLTEIVDGSKTERHLCEDCAQKEGITIKAPLAELSNLLENLVTAQEATEEIGEMTCPQCDTTWNEFRKRGLLGCPNDYVAFDQPLRRLVARAHEGATTHLGRIPRHDDGQLGKQARLLRMRRDLRQAVTDEDYETAARLRDQIRQLTG